MGNKPIKIALQTEKSKYQAGDVISGKVFLSAKSVDRDISGIHLQLSGTEHVEISERTSKKKNHNSRTYRSTHTIIQSDYPLVNGIKAGQYEYAFNWQIPAELPGSIRCCHHQSRHSFCEINYTLTAYVATGNSFRLPDIFERRSTVTLQIQAAPPPESSLTRQPLVMDSDVFPISVCCLWNKGCIQLGCQVDKPTLSPGEHVQVHCWGQNKSHLEIEYISAKWVETISWKTHSNHQTESTKRTLAEQRLDVQAYEQWRPVRRGRHHDEQVNNSLINNEGALTFNLALPMDARDTHAGRLLQVRHVLVVTVVTVGGFVTTSPELACAVRVVPAGGGGASSTEYAVSAIEEEEYDPNQNLVEAQALPDDWNPVEADVVTVPQASVIMVNDEPVHSMTPLTAPTSISSLPSRECFSPTGRPSASVAASAPDESLLFDASNNAGISPFSAPQLGHLQRLATEDPVNIPVVLEDPGWKPLLQSLSPRDYCSLVRLASESEQQQQVGPASSILVVARALASQMGNHFECRHVLACLWALPNENVRMKVLCEIASLASDLAENMTLIEKELNAAELQNFRASLQQAV